MNYEITQAAAIGAMWDEVFENLVNYEITQARR